jgi:hypothetical protein
MILEFRECSTNVLFNKEMKKTQPWLHTPWAHKGFCCCNKVACGDPSKYRALVSRRNEGASVYKYFSVSYSPHTT